MAFVGDKRELRLRVLGMHQERSASVDVRAQQAQAFVGSIPRLDYDEVQFVAQKILDDSLIARIDFEKIGEHAGGSISSLHGARLKQPTHRLSRIAVLGNDSFKRPSLAKRRGKLGANGIEMLLGFIFSGAFRLRRLTQVCDFSGQTGGSLRDTFEFHGNLPALSAKGFRLRRGGGNLGAKTMLFAAN